MTRSLTPTFSQITSLKKENRIISFSSTTYTNDTCFTPNSTSSQSPQNMTQFKGKETWKTFPKHKIKNKKKQKPPQGLGEDICRVSEEQAYNALVYSKMIRDFQFFLNIKSVDEKDFEKQNKFPKSKRVLTVKRSASVAWHIGEMIEGLTMSSECATHCSGPLPYLYRAFKLTLPLDIR